ARGRRDTAPGFTEAWSVTKDGAAFSSGTSSDFTFTPAESGTYVVTLTATDKDGGVSQPASTTITVDDAALSPTGGFIVTSAAFGNHTVATFTDANPAAPLSDFTAMIDWGDGTPATAGTVSQPNGIGTAFVVQGNH